MSSTPVLNPSTITIVDANAAAQSVTAFKMLVGVTTGGPYSTSAASIPLSSFTNSSGSYSCPWATATFSPALTAGNYFAVTEAVNAVGSSTNSPEAAFTLESAPSPPTGFSLA